jgi:serine/threonine protein phosphatase 1
LFKSWFSRKPQLITRRLESISQAKIETGQVVYAVGDVHGMPHLLEDLLKIIIEDRATHAERADILILGDMIDRGPDSARVIEMIHEFQHRQENSECVHVLMGNHEKMMIDFLKTPEKSGAFWLRHGGDTTMQSFGVHPPHQASAKQLQYLRNELVDRIPAHHIAWLENLPLQFTIGDYFFCHASINPRKSFLDQIEEDLLWSRRFPSDGDEPQEKIIVHGHLPVAEPLIANYHINVDTGAFATGNLSAVKLIGNERHFMTVSKPMHLHKGNL